MNPHDARWNRVSRLSTCVHVLCAPTPHATAGNVASDARSLESSWSNGKNATTRLKPKPNWSRRDRSNAREVTAGACGPGAPYAPAYAGWNVAVARKGTEIGVGRAGRASRPGS